MAQPVTDYAAFFAGAKQAVEELEQLKKQEASLEKREQELEDALREKKRVVADTIAQTIRQRAAQIAQSYDAETNKAKERLKKVRAKREKARNQGVKERIAEETRGFAAACENLRQEMKELLGENHVPRICGSRYYYALYFTKGVKEFFLLLLTLLVCFLLVPCGLYLLIPERKTWYLAAVYVALILLFGGLYVAIGNRTKLHHMETLKKGRNIMNELLANKKKIKSAARAIRRDKDDALYNLQKFDDEIAQLEQDLAQLAKKKKEALNTFDTVTKTILSDEITESHKDELRGLETELSQVTRELTAVRSAAKEQSLAAADQYTTYVGKEYMTVERLNALEEILSRGRASNLSEALTVLKEEER